MEEISGEIRLLRELDYERHVSYELIAVPLNGRGNAIHVTVNVNDENDNAPTFPVSSIDVSACWLVLLFVSHPSSAS